MQVDEIKIETEEDGFHLIVHTRRRSMPDGEYEDVRLDFNIHGVAVELLQEVERTIGPWHREGEQVYREFMRHVGDSADEDEDPDYGNLMQAAAADLKRDQV